MSLTTEQSGSQPPVSSIPGGYHSDNDSSSSSHHQDSSYDPFALPKAVRARKSEYTREQTLRVKVGTWNVAAIQGTEADLGKWFVQRKGICEHLSGLRMQNSQDLPGGTDYDSEDSSKDRERRQSKGKEILHMPAYSPEKVGLYVLGLQEIVDVSSPAETLRPYVDPSAANKWKAALEKALPEGYKLVAETQLVGLLLLVYAAPYLVGSISSVSSSSVGTGLLGYMGNKGAVTTRIMIGETTCLAFVNCHMSAGSDKNSLERRNWDAAQITGRTRFDPIDPEKGLRVDPTDSLGREDFGFWFGDLNYRLEDIPGDDVRQVLARHTENEYDMKHSMPHEEPLPALTDEDVNPHTDPASLQTTISSLLPHDQLRIQKAKKKAFHDGWREGEISFLPTYKYDVGSVAKFDSSEKQRGPSWCDRILYRTRQDIVRYEKATRDAEEARKRDEEMKARGLDKAAADDNVLFDYDPDVDGADSGDEYDPDKDHLSDSASVSSHTTKDDTIRLEYYMSHQGILSSDHKPLVAGFTIKYESVDPHMKAKVHQDVVRELDKAENESRPNLTVVVDTYGDDLQKSERDPNAVDFGDILFDVPITRSLTVANTSSVPATFRFEKPDRQGDHQRSTPSWLEYKVDVPSQDDKGKDKKRKSGERTLFPGELANIDIAAHIHNIEHVRLLNDDVVKLEDILVLRVANGRDHFISIYGRWLPTCFGRSVEDLTRMPEAGARSLLGNPPAKEQNGESGRLSAPRELFRLTEAISELSERAIAEWGMTRGDSGEDTPPWLRDHGAGWPFDPETWTLKDKEQRLPLLAAVREALDCNKDLNSIFEPEVPSLHRLEVLSETLLVFLGSLSDGIVTAAVWEKMDQQILTREKRKSPPLSWDETQAWVLEELAYSPAHSVSFTFVTFMLAHIANEIAPSPSTAPALPELSGRESEDKKRESIDSLKKGPGPSPSGTANSASSGGIQRPPRVLTASNLSNLQFNAAHRRQAVETTLASIFASVLIVSKTVPSKDKERRALEDRKRSIIEPFLKTFGVDSLGPSGGVP
ncbi:phosphatase family protein [Aspergillus clavatus NRRL 1]|uniref:Phosphatase family protein n=1 Tax=Aspergillus clavatus (strain ATCC 1007 / CBS 513.65 / DSM 816 / NCTC 3887 / NRRL 1 / QM 1276 / 107) TaxID=344612 RepID=A1CAR8_ASPCL|nr:phosphatase family protein [Aspergillus clavatus NRRL 1]EAW12836.1 phosphatase family protein [Aspergillus clavatus NRRL 1]